ncbi:MAG: HAD hydrolase family protein, partial [Pseudomonadota bacterium]
MPEGLPVSHRSRRTRYLLAMRPDPSCLLDFDVTVSAFSKDAWVANRSDYWLGREIKGTFLQPDRLGREAIDNFAGQHGIHKFLCRGGDEHIRRAKSAASTVVGDTIEFFSDRPTAIEISPALCSKLNGIKALVSFHKHKDEDVWVFGDADNDLDMVNHYKNSVAKGNGSKTLKSSARHVIGSNNELSISKFLRHSVLR